MENPQINPITPQIPEMPAEKSQAGTNLAIVILVLVIIVVGVKLILSSPSKNAPVSLEVATSTQSVVPAERENMPAITETVSGASASLVAGVLLGKGQVVFSVSSPTAIFVRQIFVHNPYKTGADAWVTVYDGYKEVPAGGTAEIFKASLAAITYDMVRVGFVNAATGAPDEAVKNMPIAVVSQGMVNAQIGL